MSIYDEYKIKYEIFLKSNKDNYSNIKEYYWIAKSFIEDNKVNIYNTFQISELYMDFVSTNNYEMIHAIEQMKLDDESENTKEFLPDYISMNIGQLKDLKENLESYKYNLELTGGDLEEYKIVFYRLMVLNQVIMAKQKGEL